MNAKEKLIKAFFDLLAIKDFQDINVSELCLVANVHRTTFYAYYDNTVELLVDAKEYAVSRFDEAQIGMKEHDEYLSMEVLVPYLNFIKKNANLFKAYLTNANIFETSKDFERLYKDHFLKRVLERYRDSDEWLIRKTTEFFMYGMVGLIEAWLKSGCTDSPEDIARIIVSVRNLNSHSF